MEPTLFLEEIIKKIAKIPLKKKETCVPEPLDQFKRNKASLDKGNSSLCKEKTRLSQGEIRTK